MSPLPRALQALITWIVILPLVLITSAIVAPLTAGWPDLLRTALVITLVVPVAVFWAVPTLAKAVQRMRGVPPDVLAAACNSGATSRRSTTDHVSTVTRPSEASAVNDPSEPRS